MCEKVSFFPLFSLTVNFVGGIYDGVGCVCVLQ